jgi:hypothetical protein
MPVLSAASAYALAGTRLIAQRPESASYLTSRYDGVSALCALQVARPLQATRRRARAVVRSMGGAGRRPPEPRVRPALRTGHDSR